jgi:urease accessory protein
MRTALAPAVAILFVSSGAAAAHSPIKGIGVFYNGLLHPLLVPAHLLALVAVGLLVGQHAPRQSRVALPAFVLAAAAALALTGTMPSVLRWPPLAVALAAGLAVAAGRVPGPTSWILAVAAAAAVALDSKPDAIPADQAWLALSGTGLGAALVIIYLGGLATWLDRPWQRIAIRALGSWIAASAMLVLTLDLLSPASSSA